MTQKIQCRHCGDEVSQEKLRKVLVGVEKRDDQPMRWIVRPLCSACAEGYYHAAIYGNAVL